MSLEARRTLIFAVLKFLRSEINQESIGADVKESLEVASQCLESCYEISIDDEVCKNNFDSGLDLLAIAEKSVIKKEIPEDLKEKANTYKNEGNELMRQEKFKEALDAYNKAIEIDKSNAVFYCNRAAAYSKLNDYANSIEDCKTALKIDPTYSKAWGRLGLALLSNNQIEESFEAYNKAVQLEPANEGYKQNLKIVEEKLKSSNQNSMPDMGFGNMGSFMSMFNNPQFVNMATQVMSDPQIQNLMSNLISGMASPNVPTPSSEPASSGPSATSSSQASNTPPEASAQPSASALPFGDINTLLRAGQQFAQQMNQMNPELVQRLREQMADSVRRPPEQGGSDQNPQ